MQRNTLTLALIATLTLGTTTAQAQLLGPTPYLQSSDSPFSGLSFSNYFHLLTFETGTISTPGVSFSTGSILSPAFNTDSVDADDGTIDGNGTLGRSFFSSNGSAGIIINFNAGVLGTLPTHAGVVWTDGANNILFEAFSGVNATGTSYGTLSGSHADSSGAGTTAEDRFYGIINNGGIGSLRISNTTGGIEIDHVQYGAGVSGAAPEPGTLALLALGGTLVFLKRRHK